MVDECAHLGEASGGPEAARSVGSTVRQSSDEPCSGRPGAPRKVARSVDLPTRRSVQIEDLAGANLFGQDGQFRLSPDEPAGPECGGDLTTRARGECDLRRCGGWRPGLNETQPCGLSLAIQPSDACRACASQAKLDWGAMSL